MVAQNVPGEDVGLSAGQARHDGLEIAFHDPRLSIPCQGALVQAVCRPGLHHHEGGRIVGKQIGEISDHCSGQTTHTGLHEHVSGAVDPHLPQLLRRLVGHGAVALHDPGGDLLVPLPGGVLHHHAVLGLGGLRRGHADAVVVVDFLDGDLGALLGDILIPGLAGALGHVDHCLLAQLVSRPGHAPAVVAVRGGEEGGVAELLAECLAGQVVVGHLADVPAHLLGDVPGHGEGAAQHLEGVEAEAEGLILHEQAAQAQVLGHAVQPGQRRDGILGKAAVEESSLGHVPQGHDGKLPVVALGHPIGDPFDRISHNPHHTKFFSFANFLLDFIFIIP